MISNSCVTGISANPRQFVPTCEACVYGKKHRNSIPKGVASRCSYLLQRVHSDLSGKMPVPPLGGSWCYISLIEDCSRFFWIYILEKKSEALKYFKEWLASVEKQSGNSLKMLRSDNGGECLSLEFKD